MCFYTFITKYIYRALIVLKYNSQKGKIAMKKVIMLILILSLIVFCFAGCALKKTPPTYEDFVKTAEENELTLVDCSDEAPDFKSCTIGHNGHFKIEFYECFNMPDAKDVFERTKSEFEAKKDSSPVRASGNVQAGNYGTYYLKIDSTYCYVAYIGNTLLYAAVAPEYQKDVEKIADALGY